MEGTPGKLHPFHIPGCLPSLLLGVCVQKCHAMRVLLSGTPIWSDGISG